MDAFEVMRRYDELRACGISLEQAKAGTYILQAFIESVEKTLDVMRAEQERSFEKRMEQFEKAIDVRLERLESLIELL